MNSGLTIDDVLDQIAPLLDRVRAAATSIESSSNASKALLHLTSARENIREALSSMSADDPVEVDSPFSSMSADGPKP